MIQCKDNNTSSKSNNYEEIYRNFQRIKSLQASFRWFRDRSVRKLSWLRSFSIRPIMTESWCRMSSLSLLCSYSMSFYEIFCAHLFFKINCIFAADLQRIHSLVLPPAPGCSMKNPAFFILFDRWDSSMMNSTMPHSKQLHLVFIFKVIDVSPPKKRSAFGPS